MKKEKLSAEFVELSDDTLDNVVGGTNGAARNRLDYTGSNLSTTSADVPSEGTAYRDSDMAKEVTPFTKNAF